MLLNILYLQALGTGASGEQIAKLIKAIKDLIPVIVDEVEAPLTNPLFWLAYLLAGFMAYISFLRLAREEQGASNDFVLWFIKCAFLITLMFYSTIAINKMETIGKWIGQWAPIKLAIQNQKTAFDGSFKAMTRHYFQVDPASFSDPKALLGAIKNDPVTTLEDMVNESDKGSLTTMFTLLNIGRGILEFGNIFLYVLAEFILLAFRLTGIFMIAMALDRKMAERISVPFLWTVIVFTLVTPIVSQIIRLIVYAGANMAIRGLDTENYLFVYDQATSEIIMKDATSGQPVYAALVGGIVMAIGGLVLMASPWISYKIAFGQVFEAVTTSVSGWVSGLTGAALEYAGIRAGSTLQKQAEVTQAQGQYQAETERAKAQKQAADIGTLMSKNSATASAAAQRASGIASAQGAYASATMGANTNYAAAQQIFAANAQSQIGQIRVGAEKEQRNIGTDVKASQTGHNIEEKDRQLGVVSGTTKDVGRSLGGATGGKDKGAGALIQAGGAYMDYDRATVIKGDKQQMTTTAGQERTFTSQMSADQQVALQHQYRVAMTATEAERRDGMVKAAAAQRDAAVGGINKAYSIQVGAAQSNYGLGLKANQTIQDGAMKAATITRDASIEAASQRQVARIVETMSRDLSRRIEQGMQMRF